jgi:SAM-dependent methyltransferase
MTPQTCPICRSSRWIDVLEARQLVVHVGRLFASEAEAHKATRGDVLLAFCESCGYIGNRAYVPVDDAFAQGYDASLHYSPVYLKFLTDLADELISRHNLKGKTVLEVACGPGFFLRLMLQRGCGAGIGVDPCLEGPGQGSEGAKPITWISDFYDERYSHLHVDFVACRQALHTIPEPRAIVEAVRRAIGDRPDVRIYFEVVNADNLFKKGIVWQFMYEYRSYFTTASLARLFQDCGFDVLRCGPAYEEGQYLSVEAAPASAGKTAASDKAADQPPAKDSTDVRGFAGLFREKVALWQSRLKELSKSGRKVVSWGAAGRGITFLNLVDTERRIRYIVEINPARQDKFIPGTGARVVSPEFLKEYKPDVIILTNATYEAEIKQQVKNMGLHCEFLLA